MHVVLDFAPLLNPSAAPATAPAPAPAAGESSAEATAGADDAASGGVDDAGRGDTPSAAWLLGGAGAEGRKQRRVGVLLPKEALVSDLKGEKGFASWSRMIPVASHNLGLNGACFDRAASEVTLPTLGKRGLGGVSSCARYGGGCSRLYMPAGLTSYAAPTRVAGFLRQDYLGGVPEPTLEVFLYNSTVAAPFPFPFPARGLSWLV